MDSFDGFALDGSAIIIVMGPTGSGKSSFISLLADEPVEISHGLYSHTVTTRPYRAKTQIDGRDVFLVDTPGFDDTSRPDVEILKEIAFFLALLLTKNARLAGIIYTHRISDPRMSGSATKNLRLFKRICGQTNYRHVALATTMWSEDSGEKAVQKQRVDQLRHDFWADMVDGGCLVKKHRGDKASALDILRKVVETGAPSRRPITLALQRELVVEGKTLDETAAGQLLLEEIRGEGERASRDLADLQSNLKQAEADSDADAAESVRNDISSTSARAAERASQLEALGLPMEQLAEEQRQRYHRMFSSLPKHSRSKTRLASKRNSGIAKSRTSSPRTSSSDRSPSKAQQRQVNVAVKWIYFFTT